MYIMMNIRIIKSLPSYTKDMFQSMSQTLLNVNTPYYIDTSVLLENMPLVKFIKSTFGTRVVYFP